jgi:hypothetical protein
VVVAYVDVQKAAPVNPDPALGELREFEREIVHALQGQTGQADTRRQVPGVLAVRHSADFRVMTRQRYPA